MHILITAATEAEIRDTEILIVNNKGMINGHVLEILYTGIGGTATTYSLTRRILSDRPDMILQAGIAGSFSAAFEPGSVMIVKEDVFADMGAIEKGELIDAFDLGLIPPDNRPFEDRFLVNPAVEYPNKFGLSAVRGCSVNAISSSSLQVDMIRKKYAPMLESMEGAAFHYVCIMESIPFCSCVRFQIMRATGIRKLEDKRGDRETQ